MHICCNSRYIQGIIVNKFINMNKEELLQEISLKVSTGELSREDVVSRLGVVSAAQSFSSDSMVSKEEEPSFSSMKMLYVLGIAVVVIGIMIFVGQAWEDLGSFGRIAITLGLGGLFTVGGVVLLKKGDNNAKSSLGGVFHTIGGLLVPGGVMVTIAELNIDVVSVWPFTIVFGALFLFYLLLNMAQKHAILTFFAIANGTIFTYLLVESMIDGPSYAHGDLYAYLTMVVGASYLLLAHAFREGWNSELVSVLSFFGSIGLLGAAFSRVFDSVGWQMLYFLVVIGGVFLSVKMKSRGVLIISTLFLIAHVAYITSEYFADSLGWPLALMFLGFVFIGLGYSSVRINKKYIVDSE